MSWNRLKDDLCTYRKFLGESVDPLAYVLEPSKFEHCRRVRMQSGIVGGTAVSHIVGANLVDVESELRLQTRVATRCPTLMYDPRRDGPSNRLEHLPGAQIHHVKKVPLANWTPPPRCAGDPGAF
jgi:hypothetical protein